MDAKREPFVLYEIEVSALLLEFANGTRWDVTPTLENGRANYILFQHLVAQLSGLSENSEGGDSDLIDESGRGYEVKSYKDPEVWPTGRYDRIHTAASSTFGPNNLGPTIKKMLAEDRYGDALALCRETGYDKNAFYIYTNSSKYKPRVPFRYFVVPTPDLLSALSEEDPRRVDRGTLLSMMKRRERLG